MALALTVLSFPGLQWLLCARCQWGDGRRGSSPRVAHTGLGRHAGLGVLLASGPVAELPSHPILREEELRLSPGHRGQGQPWALGLRDLSR